MNVFDAKNFARRRARIIKQMGDDAVAVFVANPERPRSRDTSFPYRASSDIIYLSGFEEPEAVIVLAPGHDDGEFVMFVRERNKERELWDGRRFGPEGAVDRFGADKAFTVADLDAELPRYLAGRDTLYYTLGQSESFDRRITGWVNTLRFRRNEPPAAPRAIVDARDLVHEARVRKSSDELEVMRRAAVITAEAHELAMRHCTPGKYEYELQAVIEHHFRSKGASFPAYESIVGAGDNATILHYTENDAPIGDNDVVLIDAGCEWDYYAADITRSFPASGSFTPEQRDLYQVVLDAQIAAIDDVQPGVRYNELQERTVRRLTQGLVDLGVLEGDVDALVEDDAHVAFYPHRVGHFLGMDVHDVGSYYDDTGKYRVLEPGMVVTVEPGLYIPAGDERAPEGMRGVGIRIEDDIHCTDDGPENLTHMCPKTVAEIEEIVGSAHD
jgi:Xaa-Pro aminopeptidase